MFPKIFYQLVLRKVYLILWECCRWKLLLTCSFNGFQCDKGLALEQSLLILRGLKYKIPHYSNYAGTINEGPVSNLVNSVKVAIFNGLISSH